MVDAGSAVLGALIAVVLMTILCVCTCTSVSFSATLKGSENALNVALPCPDAGVRVLQIKEHEYVCGFDSWHVVEP